MKVEPDDALDPVRWNDQHRHVGRHERRETLCIRAGDQERFDRQVAGQQPFDEFLAFGHEDVGPARGVGVLQMPVGLEPGVFERGDRMLPHAEPC